MIGWRLLVLISLGALTWAGAALGQTPTQEQANTIMQMANDLCTKIKEVRGQKSESDVKADVQAKLDGLAARLATVAGTAQGSIKSEQFEGLPQEAIAATLESQQACRLHVFDRLIDIMFQKHGENNQGPAHPPYNPRPDRATLTKYLNTDYAKVYVDVDEDYVTIWRTSSTFDSEIDSPPAAIYRVRLCGRNP